MMEGTVIVLVIAVMLQSMVVVYLGWQVRTIHREVLELEQHIRTLYKEVA